MDEKKNPSLTEELTEEKTEKPVIEPAETNEKETPETENTAAITEESAAEEAQKPKEKKDPLASFLAREEAKDKERFSPSEDGKKKKIPWWVAIPAVVVIVLAVVLLILRLNPSVSIEDEIKPEANVIESVDEKGEHQANVPLNENGEIAQNGSGTLLSYPVSDVSVIDVENQNGSFSVTSYTPTETDENGEQESDATVYTLVGFEGYDLQTGTADAVANDAANLSFQSIAAVKANLSEFGFDTPQAVVKVKYKDNTESLITVGADAPSSSGTYFTFGDSDTVFLADSDAVDSFLYSINDLISLTVNSSAEDVDSSQFSSLTISGTHYDEPIVLEPNNDKAINTEYIITAPYHMFASAAESADIAGAVRGVYAEKVLCVNPSEGQISQYGLSDPYAKVVAVYPDITVELIASAPDAEGYVSLMSADKAVIYSIQLGAVEWANTSLTKLRPDTVLDINKEAVSSITVGGKTVNVTTTTESVQNSEGDFEDVTSTKAEYNGTPLKDENFSVFFQNLTGMKLLDDDVTGSGVLCEIRISYSTGRADDVITIQNAGGSHVPVLLNGEQIGAVYKNYVEKFMASADNLFNGKTVKGI